MRSLKKSLEEVIQPFFAAKPQPRKRSRANASLDFEALQPRTLMATIATSDGSWFDPAVWSAGVPDANQEAIISQGVTVELDGADHFAKSLVIQGDLVVPEEAGADADKSLTTRWIHVNSNGQFIVGTETDRYENRFTLTLNGTDLESDHVIAGAMMPVSNNDGFLMTAGGGRIQFYGKEKLSFTKLAATVETGSDTIVVANVIERNFEKGAIGANGEFITSASDDGELDWANGDQIVIASSSYDYTEEEVRTVVNVSNNLDGTSTLTLDSALNHRHYGAIESYSDATETEPATRTYEIDLRAEVALLSRNIKIQGLESQDTDIKFGDRKKLQTESRTRAGGLSDAEANAAPDLQVANGVGGHIMIMPGSGQIAVAGVQLNGMGQSSQKGRYPIHWHNGGSRPNDVFRNSSVTNSNNRGVTIHGTHDLTIEGIVLHDIHGHGFFFEDAIETGNTLVGNLALGIHAVGGNDADFANPGGKDPFVVDTHDSVLETGSRFSSSAAFWITNPNNTFIGNIAAGAGDQRTDNWAGTPGPAGTGFWFAIPRAALGDAKASDVTPIYAEFGGFSNNAAHSTAVGLNFDRGSDLEDAADPSKNLNAIQLANEYSPREGGVKSGSKLSYFVNDFTAYKASGAAFYHRGEANSIQFNNLRIADSYNGPWAVSENVYNDSLFVGNSKDNYDLTRKVGGPRLYDGAGLYTGTHFAGFSQPNAFSFQVEGSSFGPTMYHAFVDTSFENDNTLNHIAHAVSDFTRGPNGVFRQNHDLGRPAQWIKAVMDYDGSLTTQLGGGVGYSIVPNVDFLVDADDIVLPGNGAALTNDIYARIRVENNNDGQDRYGDFKDSRNETLVRFISQDGDVINAVEGQNNGNRSWIQIAAKTDLEGTVEETFTIEFGRNGVPQNGFVLDMDNQDGGRPELNPLIQDKVEAARIVVKIVGAQNYTPSNGSETFTEVFNDQDLRSARAGVVYFRDSATGDLFVNMGITNTQNRINFTNGGPLQTIFESRPVESRKVKDGTKIEAEHFDNGVNGIAYHDQDAINSLGSYRNDTGVDVTPTQVGSITDGEWLEYTAEIVGNAYNVQLNISSTTGGSVRLFAGLKNSAGFLRDFGTTNVPNTGGEFQSILFEGIDLTFAEGENAVIRIQFEGGEFEMDSFEFAPATQAPYANGHLIKADLNTTTIELEHYDTGGQGAAYYDNTPGIKDYQNERFDIAGNDSSDNFRTDEDVDTNENALTGRVFDGEWLEYTVDIQPGLYNISLLKVWGGQNNGVKLFIANSNSATTFSPLGEFVFASGNNNETITLEEIDLTPWAGNDRVIRVEIVGNWMGLDHLKFQSLSQIAPSVDIVDVTPDPRNTVVGEVAINFDEDVDGFDMGDLTLTRDGSVVDISGLSLTEITPSQYSLDLSSVTSVSGNYELKLSSEASGIEDLAGNELAIDAMDQFVVDLVGPTVESVIVNDGSSQRSMVTQLTVTFSEIVEGVDENSFVLINTSNNKQIVPTVIANVINGKTVATLTFGGSGVIGGSLADGDYTLMTLSSSVKDSAGNALDGNADGLSGDNAIDTFFRFYGDINGDRKVNVLDFFQFRNAFRGNYMAAFDFDGDGNINIFDYFQFRDRFGKSL